MDFKSFIRDVPNFPKEGVLFKDITLLLQNPNALKETTSALFELLEGQKIDKVVGMESRGFIFGPLLAQKLNAGFVPIRKPGKLPSETLSETYDLEYGTDTLEIHFDAIKKGDKVLVHDDVLATGGTANAACKLIERLGGVIVQCNFLIELIFLNGVSKVEDYPVKSLMKY
ncbi:adenine phosphoribosyltransferase [Maribacter stanieri]|uniref:Adenine phosphoribosyltransferase n=1 Tax=Maribacter stanieri TaxID=440514 RepID=A0A1I6IK82_9FLAO|nr:adenine phosphoribosyltransferase [Maribacter stanieri]SFR67098.1 adenine phosphoribosyltransferase [Maribacter stanieri]|tara:strand:+ start:14 stop:526 length:513 start_codon:yes stop_codon:yes gene_type:complete